MAAELLAEDGIETHGKTTSCTDFQVGAILLSRGTVKTTEQFESSVRATEIVLDDDTLQKLDSIFPGPGGEAPNAYSW